MNMKLTIVERLLLLMVIPNTGNITQLEVIRVLREMLSFNEEENLLLKFVDDPESGATRWDQEGAIKVGTPEFGLGRLQLKIIDKALRSALTAMSQQETLTQGHLELGKKFMADYDVFIIDIKKEEVIREEAVEAEVKRKKELAAEAKEDK